MSGHSKWKTIQHKKGAADAKRGKVFSRLSKELQVVARQGGGNPDNSPSLRSLMDKARLANMPNDNIARAIKKGTGELDGGTLEEISYEGYAGGGVGLVVLALTDNRNRATAEIRHVFTKHNSSFAQPGAVSRGFRRKGQIFVDNSLIEEDRLMEIVLEAGAEDMKQDGDQFEILTETGTYQDVVDALQKAGIATLSAEIPLVPDTGVRVSDKAQATSVLRFIDDLEDCDDVQNVYSNMVADDEVLKEIEADPS
jgi:YebC/PmpR family DNA-binding regulatory protein